MNNFEFYLQCFIGAKFNIFRVFLFNGLIETFR